MVKSSADPKPLDVSSSLWEIRDAAKRALESVRLLGEQVEAAELPIWLDKTLAQQRLVDAIHHALGHAFKAKSTPR